MTPASARGPDDTAITPSAFEPLDHKQATAPPRRPWRFWLLPAVILAFVLVMGFLLAARSVEIEVAAESEAHISIDALYLPFGDRYLLLPGNYAMRITAEGYHPLSASLQVSEDDSQRFQFSPEPLPGRVTLRSEPAGASISLAGEDRGSTPSAELALPAGEHPCGWSIPATCLWSRRWRSPDGTWPRLSSSPWSRPGQRSASPASRPAPRSWSTAKRGGSPPPRWNCYRESVSCCCATPAMPPGSRNSP
ncbi:PEGA domain-containing protein [Kineobactrum salinum]|uniref:PEGA domain-containing protein n=1 Tax=Kineobactrum salinum TaxID=2708301 RepID=UPI001E4F2726|nr:PEGA domain-containing protein [Kineobactrum salinum]